MTVEGIVVPYDVETEIDFEACGPYTEMFTRGAFQRAARAPTRVGLTFRHDRTIGGRIGYGREFRDSQEGLVGVFRLDPSSADKARDVLSTSHSSLSAGFVSIVPVAGTERAHTLVVRRSVHLDHVAAVDAPAYAGALVGSIRGADVLADGEPTDAELSYQAQRAELAEIREYSRRARDEQDAWLQKMTPATT
jgi:HK97 family phage prohead protease